MVSHLNFIAFSILLLKQLLVICIASLVKCLFVPFAIPTFLDLPTGHLVSLVLCRILDD